MEQVPKRPSRSRAWWFIAATAVLLVLFVVDALYLHGGTVTRSATTAPGITWASFVIACAALGTAIASNAAAYLNPLSSLTVKIISPFVMVMVVVVIAPFFVSLGLTMIS